MTEKQKVVEFRRFDFDVSVKREEEYAAQMVIGIMN